MSTNFSLIFGQPGSGKDSRVKIISEICKLKIINFGDILRDTINDKSNSNLKKECLKSGLIDDTEVNKIFLNLFNLLDKNSNILLNSYPKTETQYLFMLNLLNLRNSHINNLFVMEDLSFVEIKKRILERQYLERFDDSIIEKRCKTYEIITKPLIKKIICDNIIYLKANYDEFHYELIYNEILSKIKK